MLNCVQKINSHHGVTWCYVPTAKNPADLGSCGGRLEKADQWWNGPKWLASRENWLADILDEPTEESKAEAKLVWKVLAVAVHEEDQVECVLCKFHFVESHTCVCMDAKIRAQLSPQPR